MKKEKLPINKDILVWARTTVGLSLEEVAHKMNKAESEIDSWEVGASSPTYAQLEYLAHDIYKRPVAVFFFPDVPKEDTPKTAFRTLPDIVIDELPSEIVKLYRRAKLFQLYLEELYEGEKPISDSLLGSFSLTKESQYAALTRSIRKALDIPIEKQSGWGSAELAFKKWREALEANGIFVFKDAFRNDDFSGFCLYDQKYPIIYVNNSMPDSRQVFTLFHELGHLLFGSGGIDFRSQDIVRSFQGYYLDVELSCNRFANELLVPQSVFDSFQPVVSEANFERMSDYFSVSREVILRNYLDRGLVSARFYEEMAAKWAEQAKQKKDEDSAGNYYYSQKTYLGEKYINLVYTKYYQNTINVDSVAEYLNIKPKNLPAFEYWVLEGGKRG